ncbi:MAG: hypothetical protein RTU30_13035, partial [Candidatus Thorarchaeota archaeon]
MVDILYIALTVIAIALSGGTVFIVNRLSRQIESPFYRYSMMFNFCLVLWFTAAFIASIYNDPFYESIVTIAYYLLEPFGILSLAFLV